MGRHLAIGDIHGCYRALSVLAETVGFRKDDTIITLGDYVDRGPNSCAVLDWLIHFDHSHTLIPLRGNHEIMMLQSRTNSSSYRSWQNCGGDATMTSYSPFEGDSGNFADVPDSHWEFLEQKLNSSYEIESHFFVHANVYTELPLHEQPDFMLYWEHLNDPPRHESGKIMVCGHTSQKSGLPFTNGNAVCIDTWAYGQGWLTCLHVESGMMWQANQQGETRQLFLDEL